MTKYTKRQYISDVRENEQAVSVVRAEISEYDRRFQAGEPLESIVLGWNAAHDKFDALCRELKEIQDRWDKRNWTWQDHSNAELVAANID